ncbi:MAG: cytochrome c3 family protein [Pseudomonadota bacterium]
MAFLIRTIAVAKSGREISRDRTLETDELVVGRSPDCDIHLPDLTVELRHLKLTDTGEGVLHASSLGELPFGFDGTETDQADIDPDNGATIIVGPAKLEISRAGNDDGSEKSFTDAKAPIQIIISQSKKAAALKDPAARFGLAGALPSKRGMAWALAASILILLLSVPIVSHLIRSPVENDPNNLDQGQVLMDASWSTGELSMLHHDLEGNCEACHVTPFVSVQDETCISCHEELGEHARMDRLQEGMAPLSAGDAIQWSIAETLGKEGPLGCVSCHIEHEGKVRFAGSNEQFCADCHDQLDTRITRPQFGNAADFGEKHPQFRPSIYTAHFADGPARISLDDKPVEQSGLKFPHDDHMDIQGGVARMAISLKQYGKPLECSDCHTQWSSKEREAMIAGGLSDDAIALLGDVKWSDIERTKLASVGLSEKRVQDLGDYKPVVMEDACESCHSLVFERTGGQFRSLSHGDVDTLMAELAAMDRGGRMELAAGRGRPGQFARGGRYYTNFGRPVSDYIAINRALEETGVCGECHIPTTTNGRRDLTPVNLPDRFLMKGAFNHSAHGDDVAECADCHATSQSNAATDLLIPDLESCRDCHLGETAVKTEEIVPSGCAMCHGYHTPTAPWRPEDHPAFPVDLHGKEPNNTVAAAFGSIKP